MQWISVTFFLMSVKYDCLSADKEIHDMWMTADILYLAAH